jgi:hypothetical protein
LNEIKEKKWVLLTSYSDRCVVPVVACRNGNPKIKIKKRFVRKEKEKKETYKGHLSSVGLRWRSGGLC